MKTTFVRFLVPVLFAMSIFFIASSAHAETYLVVLLDASGSMAAPGEAGTSATRLDEAGSALTALLQALPPEVAVGLRVMGGTPAADCYTTFLYLAPDVGYRGQFQDYVAAIRPAGTRALYQGLDDSLIDLADAPSTADTAILVITDGGDGCGRGFDPLVNSYLFAPNPPRLLVYGIDLSQAVSEELGQFAADVDGRLVNLDSSADLLEALESYGMEFENNLRIHLQDSSGGAVDGDVVVTNVDTGMIIADRVDVTDLSINVDPGQYRVSGRYLGQTVQSETFSVGPGDERTVTLEFEVYLEPFVLMLRDLYDQPLRARVTFVNSANEPVLTTGVDATHRVELPPDTYTVQVRVGDYTQDFGGVQVGPSFESTLELQIPVELAVLEVEITNLYGFPLNAKVSIYDQDGTLVDQAPSTSYLYSQLPPAEYRVTAEFEDELVEETVSIYSGEQRQLGIEIDVALGDLFVMLRTESGNDVWGWVRVYDSTGNLIERFDRERIESPDWYLTDLPVGTYTVEAEADDIVRTMSNVEITENEETEVTITFPDEVF
jgi:hypothetical protein